MQTIDLAPTLLDFFNVPIPETMQSKPLTNAIKNDEPIREACLFGVHGGHVDVTDGRYLYMRAPANPDNQPLYNYTLMPTHISTLFNIDELQEIELAEPFSFTQGCRTMKIEGKAMFNPYIYGSLLFDLETDPQQENPIRDPEIEKRMMRLMVNLMNQNDSPREQFERLGLPAQGKIEAEYGDLKPRPKKSEDRIGNTPVTWKNKGKTFYYTLIVAIPKPTRRQYTLAIEENINRWKSFELDEDALLKIFLELAPERFQGSMQFFATIIREKGA